MKNKIGILALGLFSLLLGIYVALSGFDPQGDGDLSIDIEGFFWPQQKQLGPVSMMTSDNGEFTLEDFGGHWNLMFFGYTHCPDICPVAMGVLREFTALLGEEDARIAANTRVIFVSVDVERDSPEHLGQYISFFDDSFMALTGSREQVDALTGQMGVLYEIEEHEEGELDYLIAHTGAVFLVSPRGSLAAIFHPPHDASELVARYTEIRQFMDGKP